jgi:hypothetical protein
VRPQPLLLSFVRIDKDRHIKLIPLLAELERLSTPQTLDPLCLFLLDFLGRLYLLWGQVLAYISLLYLRKLLEFLNEHGNSNSLRVFTRVVCQLYIVHSLLTNIVSIVLLRGALDELGRVRYVYFEQLRSGEAGAVKLRFFEAGFE